MGPGDKAVRVPQLRCVDHPPYGGGPMSVRRVLARIPVLRHLWQCPGCGAWTSRPLAPGESCGEC